MKKIIMENNYLKFKKEVNTLLESNKICEFISNDSIIQWTINKKNIFSVITTGNIIFSHVKDRGNFVCIYNIYDSGSELYSISFTIPKYSNKISLEDFEKVMKEFFEKSKEGYLLIKGSREGFISGTSSVFLRKEIVGDIEIPNQSFLPADSLCLILKNPLEVYEVETGVYSFENLSMVTSKFNSNIKKFNNNLDCDIHDKIKIKLSSCFDIVEKGELKEKEYYNFLTNISPEISSKFSLIVKKIRKMLSCTEILAVEDKRVFDPSGKEISSNFSVIEKRIEKLKKSGKLFEVSNTAKRYINLDFLDRMEIRETKSSELVFGKDNVIIRFKDLRIGTKDIRTKSDLISKIVAHCASHKLLRKYDAAILLHKFGGGGN